MTATSPHLPRDDSLPFLMPVEDVFTITGRGTVATGRVERGQIKMGDAVEIVGLAEESKKSVITGIEMFRKLLDYAEAGDNVGTLLRGIDKKEIERGQVWLSPAPSSPTPSSLARCTSCPRTEGGRHTPFFQQLSSSVLLPYHRRDRRHLPARGR